MQRSESIDTHAYADRSCDDICAPHALKFEQERPERREEPLFDVDLRLRPPVCVLVSLESL